MSPAALVGTKRALVPEFLDETYGMTAPFTALYIQMPVLPRRQYTL